MMRADDPRHPDNQDPTVTLRYMLGLAFGLAFVVALVMTAMGVR